MNNILSTDDKKYLRSVCRLLGSYGLEVGEIAFELNGYSFEYDDINWDQVSSFDNRYDTEIPLGLIPILQKIVKFLDDKQLIVELDFDDINYVNLRIEIDCDSGTILAKHEYSYLEQDEESSVTYEDDEVSDIFDVLIEAGMKKGVKVLRYSGGGDSGYIESDFESGEEVPAHIEEWCYDKLESNYGGWEINEGSQGQFTFNFKEKTIELEHTTNFYENESNTIYEENFQS